MECLPADRATALAEFARACKSAARAVSLYPRTHPSIRTALDRLTASSVRLLTGPVLTLVAHPDRLLLEGRHPAKPDSAVAELATLLHERLVGELTIEREATADDWHAFLLLLASSPDDLIGAGGFAKAWTATGREHFAILEIDYAEVLRERGGSRDADWDHIIACCLDGGAGGLDDRALTTLLEALADSTLFTELVARLQATGSGAGPSFAARAAALLQMLRGASDALAVSGEDPTRVLQAAADALPHMTPDLILAIVHERTSESPSGAIADGMLTRVTDTSVAGFIASSIEAERGATERLAQALEALVPETDRHSGLIELAETTARAATDGDDAAFEKLWQGAKEMLVSYSDTNYVSTEYARELSSARRQAVEVERVSDDPPERVAAWVASIGEAAVHQLDLLLLCDLLRLEPDAAKWTRIAAVTTSEIERHTFLGNADGARSLAALIAAEAGPEGRWDFRDEARRALERLAAGPLVKYVVTQLRKVDDAEAARLHALCHVVGPGLARPFAEALATEDNNRSIRRLRDLLLGFGAAGRSSVEQLKSSSNPAVRRTAIDLLRVFGGSDALPELASMLGDSDPQVQRESIRAIVQIATQDAYAVLQDAIVQTGASREAMVRELLDLRDDRTIPVFCHLLDHTIARGKHAQLHLTIIEGLGGLSSHADAINTLRRVLYTGDWWAPLRTAAFRKAAAAALRRLGSPEALAVLKEAAEHGNRGVRQVARPEVAAAAAAPARRERGAA